MLTVNVWVLDGKILSAFLDIFPLDGKAHMWHTGEEWPTLNREDSKRAEWQVRLIPS